MDVETVVEEEETAPARGPRQRADNSASHNTVVLGPRDSLAGTLTVDGEIRVQGNVEGQLKASGDVQVEGGSTVQAQIEARNVTVRGSVSGDVTAKERLVLAGSGSLNGNVKVARLSIEDGASLNGNVSMTSGHGSRAESRHEDHRNNNKEGG